MFIEGREKRLPSQTCPSIPNFELQLIRRMLTLNAAEITENPELVLTAMTPFEFFSTAARTQFIPPRLFGLKRRGGHL